MVKLIGNITFTEKNISETLKSVVSSSQSKGKTSGITNNLEYVKMLNNSNLTVRIVCPDGETVTSALTGDFSFGLANKWTQLASLQGIPLLGELGQSVLNFGAALANASQGALESLWMTSATWTGSEVPRFSVQLTFINYSKSASFIDLMLRLARGALIEDAYVSVDENGEATSKAGDAKGIVEGIASLFTSANDKIAEFLEDNETLSQFNITQNIANVLKKSNKFGIRSPWGFGLTSDGNAGDIFSPLPNTTYVLKIGNWFEANNLLIDGISNISFSKEVSPSGNPLSMSMTVTFRPYQNITYKTFSSYFKIKG